MAWFHWQERPAQALQGGGVIAPDERLPWAQTGLMGLQHVIAMFGSTVLAPILMGFDPNLAVFMSGLGTLLFFAIGAKAFIRAAAGVNAAQISLGDGVPH